MHLGNWRGTRTGVILAGGRSERFSGNGGVSKPLGTIFGVPMVLQVAASLARAGAGHVIILTGANHPQVVEELDLFQDVQSGAYGGVQPFTWEVRYSGDEAGTAGRLLSLNKSEIGDDCLLSYTDVFNDADLRRLSKLRQDSDAVMSVLAVNPRLPWGELTLEEDGVQAFTEKPVDRSRWINGGVFSINSDIQDYIQSKDEMLEEAPINRLILDRQLVAMKHGGWWRSADTPKALREAENCPAGASRWLRLQSKVQAS